MKNKYSLHSLCNNHVLPVQLQGCHVFVKHQYHNEGMIHNCNYVSISHICSCTVRCISSWLSCMNISHHNLQHFCRHTSQVHLQPLLLQAASSRQEPRILFLHPVSNRSLQQLVSVVGPGDRLSRCQPGTLHAWCAAAGPVELEECSPLFCSSGRTVPFLLHSPTPEG